MNSLSPLSRALRIAGQSAGVIAIAAFLGGCSKTELPIETSNVQKDARAAEWFCRVVDDSGLPVAGYALTIHCGATLYTDVVGIIPWGTACGMFQVPVGSECVEYNQPYYFKPDNVNGLEKMIRLSFLGGFTTSGIKLLEYNTGTNTWTLDGHVTRVEHRTLGINARLPGCHQPISTL